MRFISSVARRNVLVAAALLLATAASAQTWPSKPRRILVGFAPGGATDLIARAIANRLSRDLGQTVLVENRAGAGGTLAADVVAKAPGDGYTMLLGDPSSITINPSMMKLPYDPVRDLAAVAQVVSMPMVLVASHKLGVKNVRELVAQQSGKLIHFGTPGTGTIQHLVMADFARASGVQFTHAPYRGGAPLVTDVVGGHIPLGMLTVPTILPMMQAGTLVPLGTMGKTRTALLPEVPTFAESGFPQFTQEIWQGFFVPASTPRPLVDAIARALHKAVQTPEVEKKMGELGAAVVTSNPPEFQAMVLDEIVYWARIIKQLGLDRQ